MIIAFASVLNQQNSQIANPVIREYLSIYLQLTLLLSHTNILEIKKQESLS